MSTGTLDATNLGYLTSPPEGYGRGPTATRPQLLQLSSLGPKDFERLCFRMTRLDATVEQCRFYGVQGQAQKGIDLYARRHDGAYMVVQCKRSSDAFTPGEVTEAVDTFLAGDWAVRARTFVDFFGREAVRVFLGDDAAAALTDRLDAAEVIEYRKSLGRLYREVFSRLERGVHGDDRNVPLDDRFVLPDVLVTDNGNPAAPTPRAEVPILNPMDAAPSSPASSRYFPDVTAGLRNPALAAAETRSSPDPYGNRVNATDWLSTGNQHLVVGVPGSGKSALLRTLVLDVLADEPRHIGHVDRLHGLLPVWLPFVFWTNAARKNPTSVSVLDAVRDWLHAYDHGHLWPLIDKALRNERVLLVVDGLDEWASPDLARLCLDRLEVFAGTKHASVLAPSRELSDLPLFLLFRDHLTDRRWSQVLRFLMRGLIRPPEITAIFDALDATGTVNPLRREATDLLAADVAVGAGNVDAQTRRRLLHRVTQEIETGERDLHRAQLVDRLVAGLSRNEVRSDLEQRFVAWLRGASRETWSAVLSAAST